jgi:hypothetical protein
MALKIKTNQKCRAFDVQLDEHRLARHTALMMEFNGRDVVSPRGGGSGPAFEEDGKMTYDLSFFLAEEVADEYVERMKRPVTSAEKKMDLKELRAFLKSKP